MDTDKLLNYIKNGQKKTPVKITLQGDLKSIDFGAVDKKMISGDFGIVLGDWEHLQTVLQEYRHCILDYFVECDRRNSAIELLDIKNLNARIEPGAVIREHVEIGKDAVIMMGAILNIGASIGDGTLIDMNAVIGGGAQIGNHCHIGAGTVIKGVISTGSSKPVVIEDHVAIGPNSVVLEGTYIEKGTHIPPGSIVGAGGTDRN